MKNRIAAGQFKAKCLHLLDEVHRSRKELVITKRGRAVARLLPADEGVPALFGRMSGSARIVGDLMAPVEDRWNADQ